MKYLLYVISIQIFCIGCGSSSSEDRSPAKNNIIPAGNAVPSETNIDAGTPSPAPYTNTFDGTTCTIDALNNVDCTGRWPFQLSTALDANGNFVDPHYKSIYPAFIQNVVIGNDAVCFETNTIYPGPTCSGCVIEPPAIQVFCRTSETSWIPLDALSIGISSIANTSVITVNTQGEICVNNTHIFPNIQLCGDTVDRFTGELRP